MSEAIHGSTTNLEALADEIVANREPRDTEDFTQSSYAGLQSATNRRGRRHKYAASEYQRVTGGVARKLSAREIEELQRHVRWLRGEEPLPEPRKRKAVV